MNDYEDRKARKAERYRQYAANARQRSGAAFGTAEGIADMIPLGQPILVGHHSERRARRDQDRIHVSMRKGVDEGRRADYWDNRASAVENDTSISRHDPEAIAKLEAKIADLESERERIKRVNALVRKLGYEAAAPQLAASERADLESIQQHAAYQRPLERGYPAYVLSNLGGNLRRYKERLAEMSKPKPDVDRPKGLYARRAGKCARCSQPIAVGEYIAWFRDRAEAEHMACFQQAASEVVSAAAAGGTER